MGRVAGKECCLTAAVAHLIRSISSSAKLARRGTTKQSSEAMNRFYDPLSLAVQTGYT